MKTEISSFDVMEEMSKRDLKIYLAPLSEVENMQKTKRGTKVTIGVGLDCISGLMNGEFCGGLILCDKKQFDRIKREMEEGAKLGTDH